MDLVERFGTWMHQRIAQGRADREQRERDCLHDGSEPWCDDCAHHNNPPA